MSEHFGTLAQRAQQRREQAAKLNAKEKQQRKTVKKINQSNTATFKHKPIDEFGGRMNGRANYNRNTTAFVMRTKR